MKIKLAALSLLITCCVHAQESKKGYYKDQWQFPPKDGSMLVTADQQKSLYATEAEMKWFKDAKLGIFVHWGPALLKTNVLSWGRNGERPGAGKPADGGVASDVYDNLYKEFNPVDFDADIWMRQVKSWGAEYIVFTAKHHDGFCFFDAKNTDHNIMNTPFGRDICKELADAAHRSGVKLFWYYSQPDWSHPDCLREKHYENYLPYMKAHIKQLFSSYGKIEGVFWDHLATKYWQWNSYHLYKQMKTWQPGILTNSRMGFGWPLENRGDWDDPEQSLGPVNHHRYWQANLTMTDKWLYSPKGPVKTAETVLGMLIQVAGNGGNLLLNLGPDGKGVFVAKEVEQVDKIGEWMKLYGHTIKNTRRGIYIGGDYGATTQTGNTLYIHVLEKFSENTEPVIVLPELPIKISAAKGVTEGFKTADVKQGKLMLYFEKEAFNKNLDNIVVLTLEEDPSLFERIETWKAIPVSKKEFKVLQSSSLKPKHNAEIIYTTKGNVFSEGIHLKSWWEPAKGDETQTISLEFKTPKHIQTVLLSENMRSHSVRDFDLQTKDVNGIWKTVYNGKTIGEGLRIKCNGDLINGIRLKVNKSEYSTQITAFNVYE
ncbi:alpha-L-fucosidase [Snuella lapsa]|uniref:alpha-L-fucosidase n=1 Tax=Snuella lapsa TaxID=870481 RepID=A0ABP6Y349_9FLAO